MNANTDKPVSPQTTPESVRGSAVTPCIREALDRSFRRGQVSGGLEWIKFLDEELAYTELVEALESVLSHLPQGVISHTIWEDDDGTIIYYDWYTNARAVLAKIALQSPDKEGQQDTGAEGQKGVLTKMNENVETKEFKPDRVWNCPLKHVRVLFAEGIAGDPVFFCPECNRKFEEAKEPLPNDDFKVGEQARCPLDHVHVLFAEGLTFTHPFFLCPVCSKRFI